MNFNTVLIFPCGFRSRVGEIPVSVAVTPNGFADAITDGCFVMPEERIMPFAEFLSVMECPQSHPGIFYVQKQCSNFTSEFSVLHEDAGVEVEWASEAFGKKPDAVNFWMGDSRAVTSMHRDHYENIYLVVSGVKKFLLIPPTDLPFVPYETYPAAKFYSSESGDFNVQKLDDAERVPWVSINPLDPDLEKYPNFRRAHVIECEVRAGEALYLPSLWFHHVRQSHACIALNFWYDMEFDLKYVYYKFVEALTASGVEAKSL
ncbi:unnamed protein product [Notodromas monacha]|uniref:JmjC domain-containing protein n=1 Tax=Notodromas monacha TaxID=399045 RepID=A0A7R9GET0_9CRUS|nr:unnamed protein product [Notodromas monacha]CAG0918381.1 unnamed protein product [Notodromas monacha]